jgi:hypothetical protein
VARIGHAEHSEKDGGAERLAHFRTGAAAENEREDTEMKANDVMRIGRKRRRQASTAEVKRSLPSRSWICLATGADYSRLSRTRLGDGKCGPRPFKKGAADLAAVVEKIGQAGSKVFGSKRESQSQASGGQD